MIKFKNGPTEYRDLLSRTMVSLNIFLISVKHTSALNIVYLVNTFSESSQNLSLVTLSLSNFMTNCVLSFFGRSDTQNSTEVRRLA